MCTDPTQRPDSEMSGQLRVSRSEDRTSPWSFDDTTITNATTSKSQEGPGASGLGLGGCCVFMLVP